MVSAIVEPKLARIEVRAEMLLADLMVRTDDRALEQRERALDVVRIHVGHGQGARIHLTYGSADAVTEVPRRLVGDAERPLDLVSADPLLLIHHQVNSREPLAERQMGVVGCSRRAPHPDRALRGRLATRKKGLVIGTWPSDIMPNQTVPIFTNSSGSCGVMTTDLLPVNCHAAAAVGFASTL